MNPILQQLSMPQVGAPEQDAMLVLDQHIQDIVNMQLTPEQKIYLFKAIL